MHFSTSSWNFCGAWPDLSGTMRGMLLRHQKDLRLKLELEQGMNKNWGTCLDSKIKGEI